MKEISAASISSAGAGLPNRFIIYALEKFGKTSLAAQAPKPIFIMTSGETGLLTLIDSGQINQTPHFPECHTWDELLAQVEFLRNNDLGYRTLVIDTLNGAEKLAQASVCDRDYGGDWSDKGFMGYQRGYETTVPEWKRLLMALDSLRAERKMTIFALCHVAVRNFKNPSGIDFDRYQPDLHKSTWGITNRWVDCILFGAYDTTVKPTEKEKDGVLASKGKGYGGTQRMLYSQREAGFDAGSRMRLDPPEISMGNSPVEAWANFISALKAGKETK